MRDEKLGDRHEDVTRIIKYIDRDEAIVLNEVDTKVKDDDFTRISVDMVVLHGEGKNDG